MVDALGGAELGLLIVFMQKGRQLEGFQVMGQQNLRQSRLG
jgi:hypothetical protein